MTVDPTLYYQEIPDAKDMSWREQANTRSEAPLRSWPASLAADAFHGLAGTFVRTVEPHSEADPAALLLQFLVAFGSAAGREPH